jgi:polyhydroxyalkanoate synthesis regulator phasin
VTNKARDRAEELFHSLQKRARELVDAEDGLTQTVRHLIEEKGLAPVEVKKRLDDMVGRIKANGLWDRVRKSDAVNVLSDAKGEVERRVEETVTRLMDNLPIVTKNDLKALESEIAALKKKVESLKKQATKPHTTDASA